MADIVKYNTRVQLKYDSLTEWNKVKDTFIPLKGEVCVVNPSENLGSGTSEVLIKIGDGEKTFGALPYLNAKAADVHGWAKLSLDNFTTLLKNGTVGEGDNKITLGGTEGFVTNADWEQYGSNETLWKNSTFTVENDTYKAKTAALADVATSAKYTPSGKNEVTYNIGEQIYNIKGTLETLGSVANVMNFKGVVAEVPENTSTSSNYTDTDTGIVYEYDSSTKTWFPKASQYDHGDVIIYINTEYVLIEEETSKRWEMIGNISTLQQQVNALESDVSNKYDRTLTSAPIPNDEENHYNLKLGDSPIVSLIFDCGSASKNI